MSEPRLKMGLVGDRTPPPGLVKDLKSFDPDLRLRWEREDQSWVIIQKVRRSRYVGKYEGSHFSEIYDAERPILYLSDCHGEPDRRIFPLLRRQRATDRRERLERMKRRLVEEKKAKEEKNYQAFESSREGLEDAVYGLRSKGIGTVKPSYVPRNFDSAA